MSRLRGLKVREIERALRRLGFVEVPKRGKGAHRVYHQPLTGRMTTVSWHAGDEVPSGTVKAILDDVELSWEEFERLL